MARKLRRGPAGVRAAHRRKAALLELERELMDSTARSGPADENREAINYALFDRRDELMARIFNTPAAGLAGLAVQARTYLSEREFAECEGDKPLDFSHMGTVLAGASRAWRRSDPLR